MANPSVDASARHAIYVERLASTNANKIDDTLRDLARFTRSRLAEEGSTIPSKSAMNRIVKDINKQYMRGYGDWQKGTESFLNELSDYETQFQTDILDAETTNEFTPSKPSNKSTREQAEDQPVNIGANGGAVALSALVGGFAANETAKAINLVRAGYYEGRNTSDISASITGTRRNRFADGVMAQTKRNAVSISKTSSNHVSTVPSDNVYKNNDRAVIGYIITAVLDNRTSKVCRGWDDTRISFEDSYQPKPPFHFGGCRTTIRPWLRDDLDAIKKAQRQTKGADGKEFESTAKQYYTWLKEQPAWFQDDVLGVTEGKIFRNAGLTPQEFKAATRKRDGTPLTIAEMAEKDKRIKQYLTDL
jgi:hypothetical protein